MSTMMSTMEDEEANGIDLIVHLSAVEAGISFKLKKGPIKKLVLFFDHSIKCCHHSVFDQSIKSCYDNCPKFGVLREILKRHATPGLIVEIKLGDGETQEKDQDLGLMLDVLFKGVLCELSEVKKCVAELSIHPQLAKDKKLVGLTGRDPQTVAGYFDHVLDQFPNLNALALGSFAFAYHEASHTDCFYDSFGKMKKTRSNLALKLAPLSKHAMELILSELHVPHLELSFRLTETVIDELTKAVLPSAPDATMFKFDVSILTLRSEMKREGLAALVCKLVNEGYRVVFDNRVDAAQAWFILCDIDKQGLHPLNDDATNAITFESNEFWKYNSGGVIALYCDQRNNFFQASADLADGRFAFLDVQQEWRAGLPRLDANLLDTVSQYVGGGGEPCD